MAKKRIVYVCDACGNESMQWHGQCPACQAWNTLREFHPGPSSQTNTVAMQPQQTATPLETVVESTLQPYSSGLAELDHVLGQGLVPGGAFLISGEPGIGKSTLLLQIAGKVAAQDKYVLYASGEEALTQLKARAVRLGLLTAKLLAVSTTHLEDILSNLAQLKPALVIVDSVQTIMSTRADGVPGNITQIRCVTGELIETCRTLGTTLILVGHVTKDGVLAGPRLLEHMVDTVLALEGDRRQLFRLLRIFKNRFGPTEELLVLRMAAQGLEIIADPSTFFLGARNPELSGTAVVMAVDGQRPLAVEVQALVARSFLNIPRRTALGFDVNRLNLLLAVLEKRLQLNFAQVDIYAKVGGGMRLQEPGLDLALCAAVLSSYYDQALPPKSIFWGEVDLNGQIRPVTNHELRLTQAQRLGFRPLFYPQAPGQEQGVSQLQSLQVELFHRGVEGDNES
ncbi:MAG: DNA repair protein RadA [Desulfovibrionaceae bacterium]|nr:DNA repair protein RadA [Desulfovibrionaceae bacterium]